MGFKNIKIMPKILWLDFNFYSKNGQFINKNFKIDETLDFKDFIFPNFDNPKYKVDSIYEIFAAIVFESN